MPHRKTVKHKTHEEELGTTTPEKKTPKRSVDEYSQVMRNEVATDSCFSAYIPKPRKLSIDILAEEENIILLLRQHPITQVKFVVVMIVMVLLPLLFGASDIFGFLPGRYQFAAGLGWYLLTFGFILETFLNWFYRVFIITDERIIDVDFLSMVHKDVSTTKIDKIEDVTSLNTGFFSSLIDYGTVIIQTAATKQEIQFENVPHPARVTSLLNELILEEELEKFEGRVN